MKKILCILLSVLLVACTVLPAFAAEETYNVTYTAPSAEYEGAYSYYPSVDGAFSSFEEDPDGGYGYYHVDGCFYYIADLTKSSRKVFDEAEPGSPESVRYSPAQCVSGPVEAGSVVSFIVITNEVYDNATVTVYCNDMVLYPNANNEYSVVVDQDLVFRVIERDGNGNPILARNHFTISLSAGDGYAAKPLRNTNNKVVFYGDNYEFRVKINKGFNGDNMKVKVLRGTDLLAEYLGEDADLLSSVIGDAETLSSTGVDADGYRTYKIKNITTDCKVIISGVNKDSSSNVLSILKRILRILLGLFGIDLDSILGEENNPLASHTVKLIADIPDVGVSYQTKPSFTDETEVLNGECVTVIVSKTQEDREVNVSWTPRDETEDYTVCWQSKYDLTTKKTIWTAVWYVENITADTVITVSAN